MKQILRKAIGLLVLVAFALPLASHAAAGEPNYADKLAKLQKKLLSIQMSKGEWAGINEGDPRWDSMFMVYTYELHRAGLKFVSRSMVDQVINETITRLKLWRGFQKNGWALHRNHQVSKTLTGSILLALNHVNPALVRQHFPTQQNYWNSKQWDVSELTVLDRVIYRMMQAPGYIPLPPVNPALFASTRDALLFDTASLGYYRWGFVALTVWDWYDSARKLPYVVQPMTQEFLARKGEFVSFPERTHALQPDFWAREGLAWLLQRPHGDGNPSPTLIVQQAFLAAHRAGVMDLSNVLESGWRYMNDLRRPMRNGARVFQPSISPIWDTARVVRAIDAIPASLQSKQLSFGSVSNKRALGFLLSEQDLNGGDYLMATPNFVPGGWGFAYGSSKYPDSDDTAMVVEALLPYARKSSKIAQAVQRGTEWLLQMQNKDGGFPAWDFDATETIEYAIKNTTMLPNTSLEPQVDVTARVLRSLKRVHDAGSVAIPKAVFDRGCSFLEKNATNSKAGLPLWAGTWAVNYLYGTSEALSTALELGCSQTMQPERLLAFLKANQHPDGGWGESVNSITVKDFVRGKSTITQTLGALQLLLAYEKMRKANPSWPSSVDMITRGVNYYLAHVTSDGDISDENEDEFTACYACPELFVRYDLIPLYMGTEVLGKYMSLIKGLK